MLPSQTPGDLGMSLGMSLSKWGTRTPSIPWFQSIIFPIQIHILAVHLKLPQIWVSHILIHIWATMVTHGVLHDDILNISSNGFALGEVELFPGKTGPTESGSACCELSCLTTASSRALQTDHEWSSEPEAEHGRFEAGFTWGFP